MSTIGAAAAARENARAANGRFGEQHHADPGQVGLHQPAEEPAPVTAARAGERVRVRWAGGEPFDATMLGRCATPRRRFVIDADGDTFEVGIRDGAVTAGPEELARRARVARLAQERGVVAAASWQHRGARWVHAADCPRRSAGGRPLRPNDAVEAYRQAVEHGEAICECLRF